MLFERQNIPDFIQARSKYTLPVSSTFFSFEHGRNTSCLSRAQSSTLSTVKTNGFLVEHVRNISNFSQDGQNIPIFGQVGQNIE